MSLVFELDSILFCFSFLDLRLWRNQSNFFIWEKKIQLEKIHFFLLIAGIPENSFKFYGNCVKSEIYCFPKFWSGYTLPPNSFWKIQSNSHQKYFRHWIRKHSKSTLILKRHFLTSASGKIHSNLNWILTREAEKYFNSISRTPVFEILKSYVFFF